MLITIKILEPTTHKPCRIKVTGSRFGHDDTLSLTYPWDGSDITDSARASLAKWCERFNEAEAKRAEETDEIPAVVSPEAVRFTRVKDGWVGVMGWRDGTCL